MELKNKFFNSINNLGKCHNTLKYYIFETMENISESVKPVDLPIVFVVAMGRSGTTLFQSMLDSHPETIAPYESMFVIHLKNKYGSIRNWEQKIKDSFIADVKKEMKIAFFWDIDEYLLVERIHNLPSNTDYGTVCKQVYASFKSMHPKESAKIIVDKNPIYHLLLDSLLEVFPNAIFIHLIRDYRASSSSMHQLKKKKGMREFGFRWLLANQEIDKIKKRMPERFITLHYEDLLQNQEVSMKKITTFLNLDFHNNMVNYHERFGGLMEKYLENSSSEEIKKFRLLMSKTVHKNLTTPINPKFINKWKTKLNIQEITTLDEICGKYGTQYGYEPLSEIKTIPNIPLDILFVKKKTQLYYRLPIWLREIKRKPSLALMPDP